MKRSLLILSLLIATSVFAEPMTPLRLAVIHKANYAAIPVACTTGASPDILTDDDGVIYGCSGGVYVALPGGGITGAGSDTHVTVWDPANALTEGIMIDDGQQISLIGAPLGIPYRLAVGYDASHYLKISTDSGNRTTLEAIGSTPKIDLAAGEVRIINDATEKLMIRRAVASTQGVGVAVAAAGTVWTVTTDNGTCNGFDIVPSASWAGGTIFRVLNYLGVPKLSVNVDGTTVAGGAISASNLSGTNTGDDLSDAAYDATTWDGDTTHAPSKNAVRDKIEALLLGGGAPTTSDYLVGTADGGLSAEIVVGTTPGGELGGTWAAPTLDDNVSVSGWTLAGPIVTTPLTVQYDATNKIDFAVSSAGDTTVTPTQASRSASTQMFTIQPAATPTIAAGGSGFQVNDLAGKQRFWVGRTTGANAANWGIRTGYDSTNYMQIANGTAAGSPVTFTVVGATGITFTPTVTLSAAPLLTAAGPTIGTGSDADLTLETNNQGATDPTVTYTKDANGAGTMPARLRTFNNQSIAFNEPSAGAAAGWYNPITTPVNSVIFQGVSNATFNGYIDNTHCVGYNTDCHTGRFNTDEYSMGDNWEFTYDSSASAGRQSWVEHNWNWISAAGNGWRPHYFHFDTTANSNEGAAHWFFKANNLAENMSLSLDWPWVSVNMINGTDTSYQTAGFSSYLRVNNFDTGGSQYGVLHKMIFDQAVAGGPAADLSSRDTQNVVSLLDFSTGSSLSGYTSAFYVPGPIAPGASATVTAMQGLRIDDLGFDRTGFAGGGALPNAAILVRAQTVSDALEGNIVMSGAGYNQGHLQLNSTHLWEASGVLRVKATAPTSDGDGAAIVTTAAGNAVTATALAANGSNCSAGSYAGGVSASGAAEDCTAAFTAAGVPAAETDAAHDTCAEISGCVVGALSSKCDAWPVGAVFISVVSTNPNTLLGCGTWGAIATGQVLVGLDSGDTDFDVVEETGGAKTVASSAQTFTGTSSTVIVNHTHSQTSYATSTGGSTGWTVDTSMSGSTTTSGLATGNPSSGGAASYTPVGTNAAGAATSVVQPYFVVYMWKRTA